MRRLEISRKLHEWQDRDFYYESQDGGDTARRSGMEYGMAAGYDRLDIAANINGERT